MAKFQPILGRLSGKLDGEVYAHNQGGQYVRAAPGPAPPPTATQLLLQAIMQTLASDWKNVLTQAQRDAWRNYAAAVPLTNALGMPHWITGREHFLRSNIPRIRNGQTRRSNAPTTYDLGEVNLGAIAVAFQTDTLVDWHFDDTDPWVTETLSSMYIQFSRPQTPTRNFWKGPYLGNRRIRGNNAVPPTSPFTISLTYVYPAGSRGFWRARVSRDDGRLSMPATGTWIHSP